MNEFIAVLQRVLPATEMGHPKNTFYAFMPVCHYTSNAN